MPPTPRPAAPPLSTLLASQDRTIGARIGSSFLTRAPPRPDPPTAGRPAEPVDDLVLLVAEDVAGDGRAVLLVDRGQVGSTGEQVVVVLPEGLQDRPGTGGVAGVGLETTEQRRQHGRGGGAHLVGGGADLLRDLVGRQCAEDVVDC